MTNSLFSAFVFDSLTLQLRFVSTFVPTLDVLAAGELLIDFISLNYADSLDDAQDFRRIAGGSPANLAANLARLGKLAGLAATVGNDDMGNYLRSYVEGVGVDTTCLQSVDQGTSLILVTRSQEVSNFEPYRSADSHISADQIPKELLNSVKVFHTTCFGLSREPARSTILSVAKAVHENGGQVSIDANYASKIWPDLEEAQAVLAEFYQLAPLVKFSEVDWLRLYGAPLVEPGQAAAFLHEAGAKVACITLGDKGCYVSREGESHFLPSRKVEVRDTTGAGDAFWSGFLSAWLDGHSLLDCARAGRKMAERKLAHFGALPDRIPVEDIYVDFA